MVFFAGFGNINCLRKCIANGQAKKIQAKAKAAFSFALFNRDINKGNP